VYAPETLPDKVMKDSELKSYVENAKKKAQKESGNVHKKGKMQDQKPGKKAETKELRNMKKRQNCGKYY